ncbi:ribonuclease P protein subunit p14 isoform X2 [Bombina bombina]|uniref:ribonuclease P protein subunit p14 isoform X2 n=1 Tax=Bombina bombina TaxID=8345 RepID=UPI00235AA675|nr:ribonuclease P protein subunit p14 isoform X2 [Bombina bombina]XP_053576942.1 ribonuclease P protein subunit p14 isoform X2 [Bombina bombina]XP_053576943.1 ribonuclease P protein subunit p14 isoform X2 [Bombina bombina]
MRGQTKAPEPTAYERVVLKNKSEFHYMKIQLVFEEEGVKLNPAQFKHLIVSALKELHGEVGAAVPFDLLKYDENKLCGILRVLSSGLVKLWSSLTLLHHYQNRKCAFRIIQTSPFLLALAGNSRELILD